jgi:predicted nucleotidyltransferase
MNQRSEINRLAADRGIGSVKLFGSVLHRTDGPDSDIDLLIEPSPNTGLLPLIGFQHDLETLLGRRVDLALADGLKPHLRETVLAEAEAL